MADLLALLIEITSVPASGRQLKKPITLPRPSAPKDERAQGPSSEETNAAYKKGIGVLAATAKRVQR